MLFFVLLSSRHTFEGSTVILPDLTKTAPPLAGAGADVIDALLEERMLGRDMLAGYAGLHGLGAADDDFARWEIVAVERQFTRPVRNPESARASQYWDHSGVIDLAFRKKSDGTLWLLDHKTAAPSRWSDIHNCLLMDRQVSGYWAAAREALGEMPQGFLYNVLLKRPAPRAPRIVAAKSKADACPCGRDLLRDKAGKVKAHALSRATNQGTTGPLYRAAIAEHGLDPLAYADVLAALDLDPPLRYDRVALSRTPDEVAEWERDFYETSREMRTARPAMHVSALVCPRCEFLPLCLPGGDTPEARSNYRVSEVAHDELDDESQEPRPGHEVLSNSRHACWRQCPRKHHLRYVDRLRPLSEHRALRFGVGIHEALALWYESEGTLDLAGAWDVWWAAEYERLTGGKPGERSVEVPF